MGFCRRVIMPPLSATALPYQCRPACVTHRCRKLTDYCSFGNARRISFLSTQFPVEPGSSQLPGTHNTLGRYLQYLGGFLNAEASEESQFHYLCFPGVNGGKIVQCLVQRQPLCTRLEGVIGYFIEVDGLGVAYTFNPAASFRRSARTRSIYKDPTHDFRAQRKKLRPVFAFSRLRV